MSFDFVCPHCGAQRQVAERAGLVMCFRCGQSVRFPPAEASTSAPAKTTNNSGRVFGCACWVFAIGALAYLLFPETGDATRAARRVACSNNLKQIGIALQYYHAANGCFPPAFVVDGQGRQMHSWRVLILPYAEYPWLFAKYDLSQPWNSPKNQQLADQMPDFFRCAAKEDEDSNNTSYVASLGPGRFFQGAHPTREQDIQDGLSETIAVVEVRDSKISWLDPRDGAQQGPDGAWVTNAGPIGGSDHSSGANVLFADGSVQFINSAIEPERLAGMQTIAGGESVRDESVWTGKSP